MTALLPLIALVLALESPAPSATAPAPLPQPEPSPASAMPASASPAPAPSSATTPPPYLFSFVPPASVPPSKILEIDLNDRVLHAPGDVRVRVLTASDVVSVVVRAMGRELSLPRLVPGLFAAEDKLPRVPLWLRGRSYDVEFVAASGDGTNSSITLPLELAR